MSSELLEPSLGRYARLLAARAVDLGLIAEGDRDRVLERHVEDSLRAAPLVADAHLVADLGSGAGLPGIPLAVRRPRARFVLIEPRRKAVAFLELAVERLGLRNVEIADRRVEGMSLAADAVTARAFGPVARSWGAALHVLRPGGRLVYFAGASFEIERAGSVTDPERPASVEAVGVETSSPLVIMARRD